MINYKLPLTIEIILFTKKKIEKMTKEEFEGLIQEIVVDIYPSEKTAFDISKTKLFSELYGNRFELVTPENHQGEFNFIEESTLVLQFVTVMIATYKFIKDFLKNDKGKNEIDDLKNEWKKKLIEKGITGKDADKIVNNFAQKIIKQLSQKNDK